MPLIVPTHISLSNLHCDIVATVSDPQMPQHRAETEKGLEMSGKAWSVRYRLTRVQQGEVESPILIISI